MRILLAAAAVATALFTSSCASNDEEVDNNVISGVWRIAPGTP